MKTEPGTMKTFSVQVYCGKEQQVAALILKAMEARIPFLVECENAKIDLWSFSVPTEHAETVNAWFPL